MRREFVVAAILVLVTVCLFSTADAWGFKRRRPSSSGGGSSFGRRNSSRNSSLVPVSVRKVDEPHPYFRTYKLNRTNSLEELKSSLAAFFNQSSGSDVTWLVKNDRLLITNDSDVSRLGYKDQLEVWFANSGAPTRARTAYAFAKDARKARWGGGDKGKKEKKDKKDKRDKSGRGGRRRRPEGSEEVDVEGQEQQVVDLDGEFGMSADGGF